MLFFDESISVEMTSFSIDEASGSELFLPLEFVVESSSDALPIHEIKKIIGM